MRKKYLYINTLLLAVYTLLALYFKKKLLELPFYAYLLVFLYFAYYPIKTIIPSLEKRTGFQKYAKIYYKPLSFENKELIATSKKNTSKRIITWLLWILGLTFIGILYFTHIINELYLIGLVFLFHVLEEICTTLWCPFKSFIFKNDCCNDCVINNYDQFFRVSPLIFIPHILSILLVLLGVVAIIEWEISYKKHKERFYRLSNLSIRCSNCKNSYCQKTHRKRNINASTVE